MQSASNTVILAAAVAGVLAVGALAWRAVQSQSIPEPATRQAAPTNTVPLAGGSATAPLATTPPPLPNTSPITPGASAPPAQVAVAPPQAPPEVAAPAAPAPAPAPVADLPKPAPAPDQAVPASRPSFDVVRVEPTGDSVVAGRASPNATVTILNKGVKFAEVKADQSGAFAAVPPALPPGEHLLTFRVTTGAGDTESEQSVAVSVPDRPGAKVVAALTGPDQPTKVLSDPAKPAAGGPQVTIRTVEAGQEGAFFASGLAPPGAPVRLYLNGSFVADVTAAADGSWTLRVQKGMSAGHYDVRADLLEAGSAKVAARSEVPFDYPVQAASAAPQPSRSNPPGAAPASAPAPAPAQAAPSAVAPVATSAAPAASVAAAPAAEAGVAVVKEIQSVTVLRGDSLWRISRRVLGKGIRYTQIYEANTTQIRDPNRIWPGQVFVAPGKPD